MTLCCTVVISEAQRSPQLAVPNVKLWNLSYHILHHAERQCRHSSQARSLRLGVSALLRNWLLSWLVWNVLMMPAG